MVKKEKYECELCGEELTFTFLDKIVGTIIEGKYVCHLCQKKHKSSLKEKVKEKHKKE